MVELEDVESISPPQEQTSEVHLHVEQFSQKINQQFSHTHKEIIITVTDLADDLLYKQSCKKYLHVTSNQVGKGEKKNQDGTNAPGRNL